MSTAPSVLERLGHAPDARVVVVHADDIGMCHSANVGAFEALDGGVVSCGSLMVPCPWFAEAAQMARERPQVDLGVHLTLTSEWDVYRWGPVVGRDAVPSLCADDGCFYPTTEAVLAHATIEDVERELRAQIDKALAAGVDVTHLDSHMGTVFAPPLLDVYARLMRDYELPGSMNISVRQPIPVDAEDFDLLVRGAMAELSDDGLAPEHVAYEEVMREVERIRASLGDAQSTGVDGCR